MQSRDGLEKQEPIVREEVAQCEEFPTAKASSPELRETSRQQIKNPGTTWLEPESWTGQRSRGITRQTDFFFNNLDSFT